MPLTESIVKKAALEWFGDSFGEVVPVGRLRATLRQINPMIPEEARATIRQFRIVPYERRMHP